MARTCLVIDLRYCNITWSKKGLNLLPLEDTENNSLCPAAWRNGMALLSKLHVVWKMWQNQVWKPLHFVSHLAGVLITVMFYVTLKYALESFWAGNNTLSPHSWVFTENWYNRGHQSAYPLIEGRFTASACSKAQFDMKNIMWLSAAVPSGSKIWPQVLTFFPSHVFTLKLLYDFDSKCCFTV